MSVRYFPAAKIASWQLSLFRRSRCFASSVYTWLLPNLVVALEVVQRGVNRKQVRGIIPYLPSPYIPTVLFMANSVSVKVESLHSPPPQAHITCHTLPAVTLAVAKVKVYASVTRTGMKCLSEGCSSGMVRDKFFPF